VLKLSSDVSNVFPKVLKLSSEVSECKPLLLGHVALPEPPTLMPRDGAEAGAYTRSHQSST